MGREQILLPEMSVACAVPYFEATVKAGFPSAADDYMEAKLDLNQHLVQHPAATFFVRVDGDSMKGASINSGDLLVVDRSITATEGKIVLAVINGEFTVKRIRFEVDHVVLEPENPKYQPIHVNPTWDFQVWGVVTYVIHKCTP